MAIELCPSRLTAEEFWDWNEAEAVVLARDTIDARLPGKLEASLGEEENIAGALVVVMARSTAGPAAAVDIVADAVDFSTVAVPVERDMD